ncbi:uncharacterized protein LOC124831828 [Vigna umbellata]|uniref:uncharacterized protein LOC124831828 n=1 Tax=Vigna umbellata TaxID=87088 RepID=UPI001F5E806A|nr:uncharacterized protein LOC124831828 [Vigna umbellata]
MFFSSLSSCFLSSKPTTLHDATLSTILTTFIYQTQNGSISLTWSRSMLGRSLHVHLHNHSSFHLHLKPWNKTGSKKLSHNTLFLWNLTKARFASGPEPLSRFYLALLVDQTNLTLLVGDLTPKTKPHKPNIKTQQVLLLKRDHVHAASHRSRVYQTKTILGGKVREIQIDCDGCSSDEESLRLVFCVDEEKVLEVTRLKWKFRGSERVEVDGAHVQISWDVHDWLFEKDKDHGYSNYSSDVSGNSDGGNGKNEGHAVFMFKFENDEVGGGSGKEVDVGWSSGEWKNGKSWSSSSLSVSSSAGSFGGSSSVMEWSSVEENELVVPFGFSLVVYAWRK